MIKNSMARINIIGSVGFVKNNYLDRNISSEIFLGGTGFTIAHTLARLSENKISLIGAIGSNGEVLRNTLAEVGVDVANLFVFERSSTSEGEVNTYSDGHQDWLRFEDRVSRLIDPELLPPFLSTDFTILSPIDKSLFLTVQRILIESKCTYMYDPGMILHNLSDEELLSGITNSSIVIANHAEWERIQSRLKMSPKELTDNKKVVIETWGAGGVKLVTAELEQIFPTYRTNSIDPTGAGDVWRAGFIFKLNQSAALKESIEFANALSSISVEHEGMIEFPINIEEIERRLHLIDDNYGLR